MQVSDRKNGRPLEDSDISSEAQGGRSVLVQEALGEIFESPPFRASKQSQNLLRYIVDQTLAGHGELLKERLIGVNVFGRSPDYDTSEDPIVRARAAEVRKRLAQFYLGVGDHSPVRIEINPGSYLASFTDGVVLRQPDFTRITAAQALAPGSSAAAFVASSPSAAIQENAHTINGKRRGIKVSVLIATLLCLVVTLWFFGRPVAPIDLFWKPFVDTPEPVLLYSGANAVYMLSNDFLNRYQAVHPLEPLETRGHEFVVPMPSDVKLNSNDLVAYKDQFLTVGDLSANVRVASLLGSYRKPFDLRCGEDVAFSDLRRSPTVLIGAFNNSLTMELTGDLPFTFQQGLTIKEQINHGRVWIPSFTKNQTVTTDYAVITRMPHAKTGQALIMIAGITQIGTHAAADFVTTPELMNKFLVNAPGDWLQKNLQIILQTKVVNDIPTSPVVVAVKSW